MKLSIELCSWLRKPHTKPDEQKQCLNPRTINNNTPYTYTYTYTLRTVYLRMDAASANCDRTKSPRHSMQDAYAWTPLMQHLLLNYLAVCFFTLLRQHVSHRVSPKSRGLVLVQSIDHGAFPMFDPRGGGRLCVAIWMISHWMSSMVWTGYDLRSIQIQSNNERMRGPTTANPCPASRT